MVPEDDVRNYIHNIQQFWKINNFKTEILDWNFKTPHPKNNVYNIGHPPSSHKGDSVGDVLPYTRLPEYIKHFNPQAHVTAPLWFKDFMKDNPYVDNFEDAYVKWGSLGPFGTTVQRTCNIWGLTCEHYTPIVYTTHDKQKDGVLFCVNSKTGGAIKNLSIFESIIEELKEKYWCTQLAMSNDNIIRPANEIIFNIPRSQLVDVVSNYKYYIGAQNSIYHLSKALGLSVVGILPENVIPELVVLPLLTQINVLELEMLSDDERQRSNKWKHYMHQKGINPDDSHHIGWLYPDSVHFTTRTIGTQTCPPLSVSGVKRAFENDIYPFNDDRLWDYYKYPNLWSGVK